MRAHNIVSICVVTLLITVLFTGVTTTLVAAQPSPTIYYVPQAGSTWVNQGTAGTSYNAYVSTPSLFQTQSNGYPYWGTIGQNDFIGIPAGTATNNQNVVSWEIGFHFAGVVPGQRFQKIWDKAYGGFMIEIDTNYGASHSELTIYRATTGGSGARWYIPTDTVLRAGHNYYVQISWDTSAGPGHEPYPTVWIGEDGNAPVHQTHWDETGGALSGTGSWYNDAVGGANLGNTASDGNSIASVKTAWLNGGFFVYRQYNSIVDFSSGGSWNTDKLAWTTATPTIKPTATPAPKVTPTPTQKLVAKTPTTKPTVVTATAKSTVVKATAKPTVVATAKPTVVTATAKPTVVATAKPTVVKATAKPTVVTATAKPTVVTAASTPSPQATQLAPVTTDTTNASVPGIAVPTEQASAQTSSVASLPPQPVGEFSLLGLGIPALVVGAIYILMRKR
ncbi:MAG: hypothetical protein WCB91_08995 [Halobacteriota archaeon]